MREIKVSEVIVENRVRQNYGSLDSLERSIQMMGVLQPIGITSDKKLMFGGRRLQACKNIGKETIPVRIFDIDADDPVVALRMEREENEHRLDLTPSEKVEIAMRIEKALAGRQGQRTDLQPVQNFAQVNPGTKTRDIAAKAVDMNRETYRQAKTVVKSGNTNVIQQMDSGEKSIHAAYQEVKNPEQSKPKTFEITLFNNPQDDARLLLEKGGKDYCTELGIALLKAAGHNIDEK